MRYLIIIALAVMMLIITYVILFLRKRGKVTDTVVENQDNYESPISKLSEKKVGITKQSGPQNIVHARPRTVTPSKTKNKQAPKKRDNPKQIITSTYPQSKELKKLKNDLRKMAVIWRKPLDIDSCYRCKRNLEPETVYMAISPSLYSKGKDAIYIEAKVLTCNECRYVCADEKMILEMKHLSKGKYIDIRNWGLDTKQQPSKQEPSVPNRTFNNDFKWPSTYAVETVKPGIVVDGFEKESDLLRLGYKISGISRQRRWWILENEALPKLGLKQVANTIAANVRARKRQKGGRQKYIYAIVEWEHDLDELKRNYYRRDFTWPRTD